MCGISGLFRYKSAADPSDQLELEAIHFALRRRGPDGHGLWWNESRRLGFGHRRLAVIDLDDRALQPMHLPDQGLSIVFNGEIYNYRALREELVSELGAVFRTESDTEVILRLFAAHGPAMLEKLRGMFALAIWSESEQRLFLARDPYGIKPLYYAEQDGAFRFASQVKALVAYPTLSREPDPAGMVGFRIWGSVPEPFTIYKAVRAVPAGSWMWVDGGGAGEQRRYAHVASVVAGATADETTPVDDRVAEAVADSVRAHLVADVEVGVFLSAGIDSGALVGLMRDAGQSHLRAVTLGFEELRGTPSDEVPLASRIADRYEAEHHVRLVTESEFVDCAEAVIGDMDQPSIDGVNTWFVSKAAREHGLKVVLSGLGGDELLGGYATFTSIPALRRYGRLAHRLPFASRFGKFALTRFAPDLVRKNPKLLGVLDYSGSWAGAYMLRRAVLLPFEAERTMDADTAREGLERLEPLALAAEAIRPEPVSDTARIATLEASLYMRNQLLRDSDWASMAHSLELRVPFVDWPTLHKIAPIMARLTGGAGKRALARAPSLPLPRESIGRARSGFNIPVAKWIGRTNAATDRLASRHWSSHVANAFGVA